MGPESVSLENKGKNSDDHHTYFPTFLNLVDIIELSSLFACYE